MGLHIFAFPAFFFGAVLIGYAHANRSAFALWERAIAYGAGGFSVLVLGSMFFLG
jgi:hypothetical protein